MLRLRGCVPRTGTKREERRQKILDSARDCFAEKGYQGVTIDEVVARADIARGTYYLYFNDKRAALDALVDDFLRRINACIISIDLEHPKLSAREQLEQNLERVVELALSEPAMVKIALRDASGLDAAFDAKVRSFYQALRTLLGGSLAEGQAIGLVRPGDRAIMVSIGLGGLKEVLLDAVTGDLKTTREAVVAEIVRFLESGILMREAQV